MPTSQAYWCITAFSREPPEYTEFDPNLAVPGGGRVLALVPCGRALRPLGGTKSGPNTEARLHFMIFFRIFNEKIHIAIGESLA